MAPSYQRDSQKEYDIAVVGGGIGGLCTAIGLLKQGVKVTLYESAPSFGEIGAGVSLGPNSAKAMSLIDPDVRGAFDKCVTNNGSDEGQKHWFSFRQGQDHSSKTGTTIVDLTCPTGQSSVHRARFLDELVKLVPQEIANFGKRLDEAVDHGDNVELKFHDGTTARHSAMLGCDGVKSRTRQILLGASHPAAIPTFSGKYAYRGLIPMTEAANLVGDELARNSQMYLGSGGHILTFPIEHGETMNVVAFRTKEDGKWENEQWVLPMDSESMFRDFEGWVEATKQILTLMRKPDVWALFDHPPAPTYYKGRIAMLGDAAHASTPHQGAGAGQAIEDALVMSRLFAHVKDSKQIEGAFAAFDKVRRPRTQRQVKEARRCGLLYDGQLPGAMDDWDKVRDELKVRFDWIWDIDLEGHVREAEEAFREQPESRL